MGTSKKTYSVIYRTGGTARYQWHKILDRFTDIHSAIKMKQSIELQGYKALIFDSDKLEAIGMPETYSEGNVLYNEEGCYSS